MNFFLHSNIQLNSLQFFNIEKGVIFVFVLIIVFLADS